MSRPAPLRPRRFLSLLALPLMLALAGCPSGNTQDVDELLPPDDPSPVNPETFVPPVEMVVPPEVAKAWKSVTLEMTEKETRKQEQVEIAIGASAPLGKTGLTAKVEGFLPHFTMQGGVFTSLTGDLTNPAARVRITDPEGKELFYGFLFSLYPEAHPVEHPRYKVVLKDYRKS